MVQLMPLPSQTPSSLTLFKSRLVLPFWYWLTQVVLEKGPLNSCGSSSSSSTYLVSIKALENRYCNVDKLKRAQKPVIVCVQNGCIWAAAGWRRLCTTDSDVVSLLHSQRQSFYSGWDYCSTTTQEETPQSHTVLITVVLLSMLAADCCV